MAHGITSGHVPARLDLIIELSLQAFIITGYYIILSIYDCAYKYMYVSLLLYCLFPVVLRTKMLCQLL